MLLRRFYDDRLAQASYLVGCQACGEALIIDPSRAIDQYLAALKAEGMKLSFVTETHIHADFLSGTRELAAATGAKPLLSDEGGEGWRYGWARDAGAQLLKDGDVVMVGNIRVEALHTPGHTPEHLSFRITDTKATDKPMGVFTGDFVFVGDVGRPDLLEKAAGLQGTMEASARQLYASIQAFKKQADYLQIWPGHGAGSSCGKALGAVPSSTLGYERIANWAFRAGSEAEFVEEVLAGQPEPPRYFAVMKRLNRDGPPPRRKELPARTDLATVRKALASGAAVADTRPTADFHKGHLEGSYAIPRGGSLATYAGTLLPYDKPVYLVATEANLADVVNAFASVGIDDVAGWIPPELLPGELETTTQLAPAEAAARIDKGEMIVVDVRKRSEWDEQHIDGAIHIPLSELEQRAGEIPAGRPVVLHCEGGGRSGVGTSVLKKLGRKDVYNLKGGITAWMKADLPVDKNGG